MVTRKHNIIAMSRFLINFYSYEEKASTLLPICYYVILLFINFSGAVLISDSSPPPHSTMVQLLPSSPPPSSQDSSFQGHSDLHITKSSANILVFFLHPSYNTCFLGTFLLLHQFSKQCLFSLCCWLNHLFIVLKSTQFISSF